MIQEMSKTHSGNLLLRTRSSRVIEPPLPAALQHAGTLILTVLCLTCISRILSRPLHQKAAWDWRSMSSQVISGSWLRTLRRSYWYGTFLSFSAQFLKVFNSFLTKLHPYFRQQILLLLWMYFLALCSCAVASQQHAMIQNTRLLMWCGLLVTHQY